MNYLEFGTNENLQLGLAEDLKVAGGSFTISCWIYVNKYNGLQVNSGDNAIIGMDAIENFETLHILVRCKYLWFDFYNAGLQSMKEIEEKLWYHVAFVYDKDAMTQSIYVNGEFDNTSRGVYPLRGNNMVYVSKYAGGRSLNGRIAYLNIWSTALPPELIRAATLDGLADNPFQSQLFSFASHKIHINLDTYQRKGYDKSLDAAMMRGRDYLIEMYGTGLTGELTSVLNLGRKKWGRSKIMIVGEGRAGKTAFSNTIIGKDYEATQSTIGINEMTCEVKNIAASTDGTANTWKEFKKPEKEFETALAVLIAKQRATGKTKETVATIAQPSDEKNYNTTKPIILLDDDEYVYVEQEHVAGLTQPTTEETIATSKPISGIDDDYVIKALAEATLEDSNLILSVYDFGGQSVFNVIHPFFLTRYGVYLILFNMQWMLSKNATERSDCLSYLSHWLNSVIVHTFHKHSNGAVLTAPFAFVGTHKDLVPDPADHQQISQILFDTFGSNVAWGNIMDNIGEDGVRGKTNMCFFPVDNTISRKDPTVLRLLHTVEVAVACETYVNEEKPLSWFQMLDELSNCNKPSLTMKEVLEMAKSASISSQYAVFEMLAFFHELGILMWHSDPLLRDTVIIDPIAFFVTPATTVICKHTPAATDSTYHTLPIHAQCRRMFGSDFNLLTAKGIVSERLLLSLLEESRGHRDQIIHLMVKYGLLVPLDGDLDSSYLEAAINAYSAGETSKSFSAAADIGKDVPVKRFVVPALLPLMDVSQELHEKSTYTYSFLFAFHAYDAGGLDDGNMSMSVVCGEDLRARGFLPSGIFQQLMGRAIAWSQATAGHTASYAMFRNVAILYVGSQQFRMLERLDVNAIQIDVVGGTPLAVHERLRFMLDQIIAECMKSLAIQTLLPFTDDCLHHEHIDAAAIFISLAAVRSIVEKSSALTIGVGGARRLLSTKDAKDRYAAMLPNSGVLLPAYDVFLSYRWGSFDGDFVQKMYDRLTMYTVSSDNDRPIHTFLDTKRLKLGRRYQNDFALALSRSSVVVPIVSFDSLQRMLYHDPAKEDNVLVEWLAMQICAERSDKCRIKYILPIFFGRRNNSSSFSVENLFGDGILDRLPDVVPTASVAATEALLVEIGVLGASEGLGGKSWTVKGIVLGLKKYLLLNASELCGSNGVGSSGSGSSGGLLAKCVSQVYDTILAVPVVDSIFAPVPFPVTVVSGGHEIGTEAAAATSYKAAEAVIPGDTNGEDAARKEPTAVSVSQKTVSKSSYPAKLIDYTVDDVIALICNELVIPVDPMDILRLKLNGEKLVEVQQASDFSDLGLSLTGIHARILLKACRGRMGGDV